MPASPAAAAEFASPESVAPANAIEPPVTGPRPQIARAMVDLPEPDSPIRASTRPGAMSSDTPATARTDLRTPTRYSTMRFSIRSNGGALVETSAMVMPTLPAAVPRASTELDALARPHAVPDVARNPSWRRHIALQTGNPSATRRAM